MTFNPEIDKLTNKLLTQLKNVPNALGEQEKEFINQVLQESYDNGYEDGLSDGEEISEKPISG